MVVGQDGGGGVGAQHIPQQLAGIDADVVRHTLGGFQVVERMAGIVHQNNVQHFVLQAEEQRLDVLNGVGSGVQCSLLFALFHGIIAAKLHNVGDQLGAARADALHLHQLLRRGFHHAAKTAEMVDQPVRQGIRILARNGQVQHIFQHFVFGQAFHAVVRHTLLHAGTMILVNRPLFAVCHGSTSFLPLYVFLILLYTEREILQRDK